MFSQNHGENQEYYFVILVPLWDERHFKIDITLYFSNYKIPWIRPYPGKLIVYLLAEFINTLAMKNSNFLI